MGNKYPNGKLNKDDEGKLQIKISEVKNRIVIDFGKPVHWIGFTKEEAIGLANLLIKKASGKELRDG